MNDPFATYKRAAEDTLQTAYDTDGGDEATRKALAGIGWAILCVAEAVRGVEITAHTDVDVSEVAAAIREIGARRLRL